MTSGGDVDSGTTGGVTSGGEVERSEKTLTPTTTLVSRAPATRVASTLVPQMLQLPRIDPMSGRFQLLLEQPRERQIHVVAAEQDVIADGDEAKHERALVLADGDEAESRSCRRPRRT